MDKLNDFLQNIIDKINQLKKYLKKGNVDKSLERCDEIIKSIESIIEYLNNNQKKIENNIGDIIVDLIGSKQEIKKIQDDLNVIKEDEEFKIKTFKKELQEKTEGIRQKINSYVITKEPQNQTEENKSKNGIIIKDKEGNNFEIIFLANKRYFPQKNNNFQYEETTGIIEQNFMVLLREIQYIFMQNDMSQFSNGEFILNPSQRIKKYSQANLNGTNGSYHTHLIFYLQKTINTITIYICDYITIQDHNTANKGVNTSINKYAKIIQGEITREDYQTSGKFTNKDTKRYLSKVA